MQKGFTLLELLIVIGILAILATTTVLVLNPAELLRQARDSQRVSDLSTLNSALSLYLTAAPSPSLHSPSSGACASNVFFAVGGTVGGASTTFGATCGTSGGGSASTTASRAIDGLGWLPVNFTSIPGGSPLSILPVDPSNSSTTGWGLVYRYKCDDSNLAYELNGVFESAKYGINGDNLAGKDGGTCDAVYEVGNQPGLNL